MLPSTTVKLVTVLQRWLVTTSPAPAPARSRAPAPAPARAPARSRAPAPAPLPFFQFNLGFLYVRGEGVEKDEQKAAELFRRCAALDWPRGVWHMAAMLDNGSFGVERDLVKALEYYRKAAELGEAKAMTAIGELRSQ